jgi:type IV pilus assembly protein PilW
MVAMLLGLFLVAGVIAVFEATSRSNHAQQSLARVLENGRYASEYLFDELRMAGTQYCSSYAPANLTKQKLNPARALMVNVKDKSVLPPWIPSAAAGPYAVDPGLYIRGYDCDAKGVCSPALPTAATDINVVPAAGTAPGNRAFGTDVLTIRYLAGSGATIAGMAAGTDPIAMGTAVSSPPLNLGKSSLAMIADCGSAELFVAEPNGAQIKHDDDTENFAKQLVGSFTRRGDARVFNFAQDFVSVTYYVGLAQDNDNPARVVSSLMRIVNGGTPEVIVDGVERLDFTYSVVDGDAGMHFLDASQVEAKSGVVTCPPVRMLAPPTASCLWRGVQGIEASLLLNSVVDDGPGNEPFRYSPDGDKLQTYAANDILPSGLPAGRMLRREFHLLATTHSTSR